MAAAFERDGAVGLAREQRQLDGAGGLVVRGDFAADGDAVAGEGHRLEARRQPDEVLRPAGPVGDELAEEGHRQHAVCDHRRKAAVARERLVIVDAIEVARGAGVLHELRGRDRRLFDERQRIADADFIGAPGWSSAP